MVAHELCHGRSRQHCSGDINGKYYQLTQSENITFQATSCSRFHLGNFFFSPYELSVNFSEMGGKNSTLVTWEKPTWDIFHYYFRIIFVVFEMKSQIVSGLKTLSFAFGEVFNDFFPGIRQRLKVERLTRHEKVVKPRKGVRAEFAFPRQIFNFVCSRSGMFCHWAKICLSFKRSQI